MAVGPRYQKDVDAILSHRHDLGADFWTTEDRRLFKGSPFSALGSGLLLAELGMDPNESPLREVGELFFDALKDDGRFKVYPSGGIYPCHTAHALQLLCAMGHAEDPRLLKSFEHFRATSYQDGGWRCNKFSFGRGPETEYSNPLPTLVALDCFRHRPGYNDDPDLRQAVEFLLMHWTIKRPIGPCQYGIGTLFMQVQYPFRDYNLFPYVHVLSHYDYAKRDERFLEAFHALQSKTVDGQIVVESVVPKLAKFEFCKKGAPSELGTRRYREILDNLAI